MNKCIPVTHPYCVGVGTWRKQSKIISTGRKGRGEQELDVILIFASLL